MKSNDNNYIKLIENIGTVLREAKETTVRVINTGLVSAYWEIGRHIINYEQKGTQRAEYGSTLLTILSKDLQHKFGKGFGRRNVLDMRRFYLGYPIWQTVSAKLSWSHYIILLGVTDNDARKFYQYQCEYENWSVRELDRQIDSSLFERFALSNDKRGVLKLSQKNQTTTTYTQIVKDPYVLDFLNIPQHTRLTEKKFEQKIINSLQLFMLELGKGFAFVGRQYKISVGTTHFYVDLVFYHRILKCFIPIDLKIRKVKHGDIGQMNLYLNYFKKEENMADDNEPIGIILSAEKDEVLVEYAMGEISNKIFVSKYQLYLPNKDQLVDKVKELLEH